MGKDEIVDELGHKPEPPEGIGTVDLSTPGLTTPTITKW
jgi:hypothetical protein